MAVGLAVSDVVNVQVVLSPSAVPVRNFGTLLIMGPSDVIDVVQRLRPYTSLSGVASDFGTTAPEYFAAAAFFSQNPQPQQCYIGRWAQNGSSAILRGGVFTANAQAALLASLNAISTGTMTISVDGTSHPLSALSFSSATSLNAVAGIIGTALPSAAVSWDPVNGRFNIESKTLGTSSTMSYATNSGTGIDVSATLQLTSATASSIVAGIAAETPVSATATMSNLRNDWYGLMFAPTVSTDINTTSYLAIAAFIEAASPARIFGYTTLDPNVGVSTNTTNIAYQMKAMNYTRTFGQYSSTNPYAVGSIFGRAFSVDFTAQNSVITLDFKQEPGITAETITEAFSQSLIANNCNVFVNYSNSAAILQPGVMANGGWFDVIYTTDWYANNLQTALFNALYTTPTKIPQTEAGINQLVAVAENCGAQAVTNGMLAAGVWTGPPIGSIVTGQTLTKGYYTYTIPLSSQSASDRAARKSPTIQQAIKLAGAVQSVNAIVTVNQ